MLAVFELSDFFLNAASWLSSHCRLCWLRGLVAGMLRVTTATTSALRQRPTVEEQRQLRKSAVVVRHQSSVWQQCPSSQLQRDSNRGDKVQV